MTQNSLIATRVIRYVERPELWEDTAAVSQAVWPEYNQHGDVLARYWERLLDDFPEFQFVLYDDLDGPWPRGTPSPCAWDGTVDGLGDGIDAMIAGGFEAREAGRGPTYPKDFTPVCTTELGYMARSSPSSTAKGRGCDHRRIGVR